MAVSMASFGLALRYTETCYIVKSCGNRLAGQSSIRSSFGSHRRHFRLHLRRGYAILLISASASALSVTVVKASGLVSPGTGIIPLASSSTAVEDESNSETDTIPTPVVIIDQDSDPNSTVVEITFGDRLGALLDTMNALKNLGLNVVKANVYLDSSGKHNKFSITKADTGRKVEDPELLEAIRLTIINNLIEFHPESSSQLAMGVAFGIVPPKKQVDVDIATHINIYEDGPDRSLLYVETADRPGLLVDLVKIVTEINIAVESGEFDTEGLLAKAKFHVSYRGKSISKPLQLVLTNSLRYFLRRPSTEEASF